MDFLAGEQGFGDGDQAPFQITYDLQYGTAEHGERRGLAQVKLEIHQDQNEDPAGQIEQAERLTHLLALAFFRAGIDCR